MTDPPSFLDTIPEQVETGIAQEIRKCLPVLDARDTAAIAMVPVRPVLEAKDVEIARLREKIASYENAITWNTSCTSCATVLDSSIAATFRAEQAEGKLATAITDERKRIAAKFRAKGMYAAANDVDPLGLLDGARAAGGTE